MLSPPLDMAEKWFAPYTAYAMAKFGMSLVVLGLAGELRGKVAVNALWPRTTIATAAIKNLLGGEAMMRVSRKPEILAEAAYRIFHKPKSFTGNFLIDDTFLAGEGVTDFDQYRVDPSQPLQVDFFVPDDMPPPKGVSLGRRRNPRAVMPRESGASSNPCGAKSPMPRLLDRPLSRAMTAQLASAPRHVRTPQCPPSSFPIPPASIT